VNRDEGHARFCELAAFGKDGGFGGLLLRASGFVLIT